MKYVITSHGHLRKIKYVLPRLIDLAMWNKDTTRLRAEWIPRAQGDVLEVGIGSGLNLAFYSSDVQRVYGVDPSNELGVRGATGHKTGLRNVGIA
jgi:protein-L-isoaspartate O-methyltransferase